MSGTGEKGNRIGKVSDWLEHKFDGSVSIAEKDGKKRKGTDVKNDLKEMFDEICSNVYNTIISSVKDKPYQTISSAGIRVGDGVSAYWFMEYHYSSGGVIRIMQIYLKLFNLKNHNNLDQYTYNFRNYISNLATANQPSLPPELLAALYMHGLDERYDNIINTISTDESKGQSKRSKHKSDGDTKDTVEQAHAAKERNKGVGEKKVECYNCKKWHKGGERACKAPCRICKSTKHTRYGCPKRKSKNQRGVDDRSGDQDSKGNNNTRPNGVNTHQGFYGNVPTYNYNGLQPYYPPMAPVFRIHNHL